MPDLLEVPSASSSAGSSSEAAGPSKRNLRQRFKNQVDVAAASIGKEIEELHVKLKKKVSSAPGFQLGNIADQYRTMATTRFSVCRLVVCSRPLSNRVANVLVAPGTPFDEIGQYNLAGHVISDIQELIVPDLSQSQFFQRSNGQPVSKKAKTWLEWLFGRKVSVR